MTRTPRPRKPEGGAGAGPEEPLPASLRMLSRRALSEGEIRERLAAKGFPEERISAALERLRELGLADDPALCGRLARTYRDARRMGPRAIGAMLLSRRFSRDLVEESVGAVSGPEEVLAAASAALEKKYRSGIPGGREGAAKAYRFLYARGFSPETCRRAIRLLSKNIEEEG